MDLISEKIAFLSGLQYRKKIEDWEEIYDLIDLIAETSDYHLEKLQEEFIRNLNVLVPYIEKMYGDCSGMDWPYQARRITEGRFPLEEIPNHLRSLVERLYYSKI